MSGEGPASGSGSRESFSSFWQNSVNKLSSKTVKFMPNVTKPNTGQGEEGTDDPTLQQKKQHRRAQVRKAQIEHRQRKQNYVKFLEEDVKHLREMIAGVETEKAFLRVENSGIKTSLMNANIPFDHLALSQESHNSSPSQLENFNNYSPISAHSHSHSGSSPSSIVSMKFDHMIYGHCLQVSNSHSSSPIKPESLPLNNLNLNSIPPNASLSFDPGVGPSSMTQGYTNAGAALHQSHTRQPSQTGLSVPPQLDISSIAINFILALEHPCRKHFHASQPTSEWDPKTSESNHELMASTILYAHAPPSVFDDLDNASWPSPPLELSELLAMSQSLNSSDFEITPVQAWFLLQQNYKMAVVLRSLDTLKHELTSSPNSSDESDFEDLFDRNLEVTDDDTDLTDSDIHANIDTDSDEEDLSELSCSDEEENEHPPEYYLDQENDSDESSDDDYYRLNSCALLDLIKEGWDDFC
ncbi:hypothetical protein B7463_g4106, partial [Scytalidium lignicola]